MGKSTESFWRRADVWAVVFGLVFPTLVTWLYFVLLADRTPRIQQVVFLFGKGIQFAFPVVWVLAVQRGSLRWKPHGMKGLAESLGFGLFVFVAMLLLYHGWLKPAGYLDSAAGEVRQKVQAFGADSPAGYFALGAFYALGHSFLEEYYWRWFVFGQLRRLVALRPAIVVSSVGFMAHHVLVLGTFFQWSLLPTALFSLAVAVGGAVWAWIYHRSDSLYGPWLSHLLVDAAIFTIGYHLVGDLFGA